MRRKKPYSVTCLADGSTYTISAFSSFDALQKMADNLGLKHNARNPFYPEIYKHTLYFDYKGKTYATYIV